LSFVSTHADPFKIGRRANGLQAYDFAKTDLSLLRQPTAKTESDSILYPVSYNNITDIIYGIGIYSHDIVHDIAYDIGFGPTERIQIRSHCQQRGHAKQVMLSKRQ
jgi:hypothetical protein